MRRLPRGPDGRFRPRRRNPGEAIERVIGELGFLHSQGKGGSARAKLLERRLDRLAEHGESVKPLFFEAGGHAIPYEAHLKAAGIDSPAFRESRQRHERYLRTQERYDQLESRLPAAMRTGAGSRRRRLTSRVQGVDQATLKRKRTMAAIKAGTRAPGKARGTATQRERKAYAARQRESRSRRKAG